jgi:hypothetical protein
VQMQSRLRGSGGRGMGGRGGYRSRNRETWDRFFSASDPKQIKNEVDAREFVRLLVDLIKFQKDVKSVVYQLVSAHAHRCAAQGGKTRSISMLWHPHFAVLCDVMFMFAHFSIW